MKRVVLAGGSGFLGRALARHFHTPGWEVVTLTRSPKTAGEIFWDGETVGPWQKELEGAVAVVNLTGRSVNCRYTAKNRREILDSRVNSTCVLGEAIANCANPPQVWLNLSTATIYKHTLGPAHDESGFVGSHYYAKDAFSVEVAQAWEATLNEATTPRTRKVALRSAMVLGLAGNSVFPTLQRLARFGLGGRMGSGKQFVSWIHERDFCRAIEWIIEHEELAGIVNVAAPNPVTNSEMMRLMREACGAPFGLPAARWMLEAGAFFMRTETELIIKSRRVISQRLHDSGFAFEFPEMRTAFHDLTGAQRADDPSSVSRKACASAPTCAAKV